MLGFLLMSLAFAEPQFAELSEGELAPFAGRLLNDEAIIKIAVEDKFKVQQCEIQIDYEKQKLNSLNDLELQKVKIDLNSQVDILNQKVIIRDDRIKELERLSKPIRPILYVASGFLVGAGTTIGILYAVY